MADGFIVQTEPGASFHPSHGRAPYNTYHGPIAYRTSYGLISLPVARKHTPGKPSARIVRLHAPVTHRVQTVLAERAGDWPELPKPEPQAGEVLSERIVTPFAPELSENGTTRIFRVQVEYVFLCTTAKEETDHLPAGGCPWDNKPGAQNELPPAAFTERLAAK